MRTNDIALFDLSQVTPSNQDIQNTQKDKHYHKTLNYEYLFNGFHSGPITAMDICIQRPIVVTACEQDSSVRIWNYLALKCDLARKFTILQEGDT